MNDNGYKRILEELLDLLDEGVYIVDENGVGIFYNRSMADVERINVDDVVGKEYHKAFPGIALSESTMFQALKKEVSTLNKQQTYTNLYGREVTTVNSTVPVKEDGRVIAAVEVATDITDLRKMSDTIMELRAIEPGPKPARPAIRHYTFDDLVGEDPAFSAVMTRARKAALNSATVFIYGETGTGKELFAQSIHFASPRKDKPFLAQNCAALPQTLLEGILFGTAKGGFTGAVDRAGLFEQASGGTLLLDEVSAMPYELQGKLLRVLQEQYIRRVGGTKDIPVDTRIIATVNEPPDKLMSEGKLRKDLYYRLNVVNLSLPPLRKRKSDIPLLAQRFLEASDRRFGKALDKLAGYEYPGNIRELENIITQAVSMAGSEHVMTAAALAMPTPLGAIGSDIDRWDRRGSLPEYLDSLEREMIREALADAGGNISRAAEALGIKRQTLQHKMKKYGFHTDLA